MNEFLGRVNIGWTLGEETLFDSYSKNDIRKETVYSDTESCLLGINKTKLSMMQKNLLDSGNSKDYYVIESTLKGNNLIKKEWYKNMLEGVNKADAGSLDLDAIDGLTNV